MEVGNRHRTAAVLAAIAAALLVPAIAFADSVATTEAASNVTFTSATLNGTVDASQSASYFFQWGTPSTSCRGNATPTGTVNPGPQQHVSANITNLTPGVTYCFHLVVQQVYEPTPHVGQDMSFTTPLPGAIATTGDATSITNGSARLNGVINTTSPSSLWAFQYGRTNSYGTVTQSHPAGAGVTVVSLKITGLSPGTKYHFRLIVSQGITNSTGADHSLTTTKLRLRKRKLRVSHHKVTIPLKCNGASGATCQGRLRITARGGHVRCAGGRFSVPAGTRMKLKKTVRGRCLKFLHRATHHRLRGRFRAIFDGTAVSMRLPIRLFG